MSRLADDGERVGEAERDGQEALFQDHQKEEEKEAEKRRGTNFHDAEEPKEEDCVEDLAFFWRARGLRGLAWAGSAQSRLDQCSEWRLSPLKTYHTLSF